MYCDRCLKDAQVKEVKTNELTILLCEKCHENEMAFRKDYPACKLEVENWHKKEFVK